MITWYKKSITRDRISKELFTTLPVSIEHNSENKKAGVVEMVASYHMGRQKRGKGHNSSTGHGAVMGLTTGKAMEYSTRCKNCRFCAKAKAERKQATAHDCRKNHVGSSKSMESSVACIVNSGIKHPNCLT